MSHDNDAANRRQRRADLPIYKPGALRQLKTHSFPGDSLSVKHEQMSKVTEDKSIIESCVNGTGSKDSKHSFPRYEPSITKLTDSSSDKFGVTASHHVRQSKDINKSSQSSNRDLEKINSNSRNRTDPSNGDLRNRIGKRNKSDSKRNTGNSQKTLNFQCSSSYLTSTVPDHDLPIQSNASIPRFANKLDKLECVNPTVSKYINCNLGINAEVATEDVHIPEVGSLSISEHDDGKCAQGNEGITLNANIAIPVKVKRNHKSASESIVSNTIGSVQLHDNDAHNHNHIENIYTKEIQMESIQDGTLNIFNNGNLLLDSGEHIFLKNISDPVDRSKFRKDGVLLMDDESGSHSNQNKGKNIEISENKMKLSINGLSSGEHSRKPVHENRKQKDKKKHSIDPVIALHSSPDSSLEKSHLGSRDHKTYTSHHRDPNRKWHEQNTKSRNDPRLFDPYSTGNFKDGLESTVSTSTTESKKTTSSEKNIVYHVETKPANPHQALIADQRREMELQLGEEIKPLVFINPVEDVDHPEDRVSRHSHKTGSIDWAAESWKKTQEEKVDTIAGLHGKVSQYSTGEKAKPHSNLEYEENLTQFLNRRQHHGHEASQRLQLSTTPQLTSKGDTFNNLLDQRGIVQNNNVCLPSAVPPPLIETKQLFNPDDPSKPLIVPVLARDQKPVIPFPSTYEAVYDDEDCRQPASEQINSEVDVEELLHNIQRGECDINYYIKTNQVPREFSRMMDIRTYLQSCYTKLFTNNILLCHQKNVETQMWKTLYYNIIEKLREYIMQIPELQKKSMSTLMMLVQEGHKYLQGVICDLESRYELRLSAVVHDGAGVAEEFNSRQKMALGVVQRLLIDLGDLARYRFHYTIVPGGNSQFSLPYRWYQLASRVYPRNGRPFHQLAILSVTQKRPLDVFYYYVRSLVAANSFTSAKDSLTRFFAGIRNKYESLQEELKAVTPPPTHQPLPTKEDMAGPGSGGGHREVWVRPGGGATRRRTHAQEDDSQQREHEEDPVTKILQALSPDQLMKQFLTCFLHCHGLLFSRVSLEVFPESCGRALLLYAAILRVRPLRLSAVHLQQIHALNMFAVTTTQLHDTTLGQGYRSAAQELALVLAQEMFGRLAQHLVTVLPFNINTKTGPGVNAASSGTYSSSFDAGDPSSFIMSSSGLGGPSSSPCPGGANDAPPEASSPPVVGGLETRVGSRQTSRTNSWSDPSSASVGVATTPVGSDGEVLPSGVVPSATPPVDPFDVVGMTWVLDAIETRATEVEQLPRLLMPEAAHFVPAIKVWCDWLLYSSPTWHPPSPHNEYSTPTYDCWSSVAELATILHGLAGPDVPLVTAAAASSLQAPSGTSPAPPREGGGYLPLLLDEDKFLGGFEPLLSAQQVPPMYTSDPAAVWRGCDWVRVQQLQTVLYKFLCGLEPPVLRLQKTPQGELLLPAIASPAETPTPPQSPQPPPARMMAGESDTEEEEHSSFESDCEEEPVFPATASSTHGEEDPMTTNIMATIRTLWYQKKKHDRRKKMLRRAKRRALSEVTVELEVRPVYVVPDTNCFITHLPYLERLVAVPSPYTLLVPLVVVSELEGLSRRAPHPNGHCAEVVRGMPRHECARLGRQFLNSRQHNIKTVTTQGSILLSPDFSEAQTDTDMTNDDKILACCLHFCRPDTERPSSEGAKRVICEAVLLTADRNLKIKAYTANVPVRSVHDFRKWASIEPDTSRGGKTSVHDNNTDVLYPTVKLNPAASERLRSDGVGFYGRRVYPPEHRDGVACDRGHASGSYQGERPARGRRSPKRGRSNDRNTAPHDRFPRGECGRDSPDNVLEDSGRYSSVHAARGKGRRGDGNTSNQPRGGGVVSRSRGSAGKDRVTSSSRGSWKDEKEDSWPQLGGSQQNDGIPRLEDLVVESPGEHHIGAEDLVENIVSGRGCRRGGGSGKDPSRRGTSPGRRRGGRGRGQFTQFKR